DGSGSRVFEHQLINDNGVNRNVYNLFVAGDTWYRQEAGMANAAVQPLAYLGLRPAGIEEFLVGVRMKGIVKGEAMAELLRRTGAIQNGTDRDGKKATARSIVYRIPATPYDEARGYQSLMVWVRVGDFKLVRTALALPVGTERTDYQNIIDGRHFPEAIFTLPGETAEDLGRLNIPQ
ncbi:MAG TPA: hypothetical protein VEI97_03945, partial [bacterium]|nr:hypothetical protein [bacterium]